MTASATDVAWVQSGSSPPRPMEAHANRKSTIRTQAVSPSSRPHETAPKTPLLSEWLTASEAAEYLKVKERTILLWARQGKVKGHVLSGTRRCVWRFRHEDLDAMLTGPSVALANRRIQ
jgi:excisionase family DNA binding protein